MVSYVERFGFDILSSSIGNPTWITQHEDDDEEDFDFDYEDEDEEEPDAGLENKYYNAKGFEERESPFCSCRGNM